MQISKEYEEFLKDVIYRRRSAYEKLCRFSEKFHISPSKGLEKRYKEAIDFAHLEITPKGAFSFSIIASILFSVFFLLLAFAFDALSFSVVVLITVFDLMIFYYLYNYPFHLSTMFRIKASSEMVLGVVYMTIAMRITPNLENAVKFAATNLTGPLSFDLRKMIWDLYTRKYDSISEALDDFGEKWKSENEEFVESINLVQTSMSEAAVRREKALDEAVSLILSRTKERMRHYANELRTPVSVLNAMGILLPIIGLAFFPMVTIFMPDVVKPVFLSIGYNVILPITIFWMMKSSLEKRPYSFYQPDISKHPKFAHEKLINKVFILSIIIPILPMAFGFYRISTAKEVFSFNLLIYSLLIIAGISSGIIFYCIFSTRKKLKLREEIVGIETEFAEALFQLGNQLARGIPIEKSLRDITPKIKDLKISKFFEIMLYNMETFGMTFERAIFDKESGAMNFYPSRTIEAVMRAVVEISKKGMDVVSKAMISISSYLKDVRTVEEDLKDVLSESTSTMNIQALLLAPLTSGIVVAMAAMMMQIMVYFKEMLDKLQKMISGPFGPVGGGFLDSLLNINRMMPVQVFQMIVGVYMIEVVGMLAIFLSIINNGEENLMKRFTVGKFLLISMMIYIAITISIYLVFVSIMPITLLMK